MAKQTIKEITKKIEASLPEISVIAANADVLANNTALGDITRRIFNEGKRSDGSSIGQYKVGPYKNKRESSGRQTNYIDFQFSGDLFYSIQVGNLNGKPAVGIISQKEADISENLEKRFGTVFQASEEERKIALETARDYTFEKLKELMKTWS